VKPSSYEVIESYEERIDAITVHTKPYYYIEKIYDFWLFKWRVKDTIPHPFVDMLRAFGTKAEAEGYVKRCERR
jgi:hypothetical protein